MRNLLYSHAELVSASQKDIKNNFGKFTNIIRFIVVLQGRCSAKY
jgi:hypothetical protein